MPVHRLCEMTWEEVRDADRASAVAILLIIGILAQPEAILTKEVFIRLLGVLLILDVLSNLALLLLSRLRPSR